MNERNIEFLQNLAVFGGLSADTLTFLLGDDSARHFAKGEYFFRENDKAKSFFVILEGKVAILKSWQGKDYHLRYLSKGDLVGEMALIDFCNRSASVLAAEDCTALEITTMQLYQLYKKDIGQYALLYMNMGREVSRRLREADLRIFRARMEAKVDNGDYSYQSV